MNIALQVVGEGGWKKDNVNLFVEQSGRKSVAGSIEVFVGERERTFGEVGKSGQVCKSLCQPYPTPLPLRI